MWFVSCMCVLHVECVYVHVCVWYVVCVYVCLVYVCGFCVVCVYYMWLVRVVYG